MKQKISSSSDKNIFDGHQEKLNSALIKSIDSGHFSEVQRLITIGANIHSRCVKENKTALERAIQSSSLSAIDVVSVLLKNGSNPNTIYSKNEMGWSPFMMACFNHKKKLIFAMLESDGPIKIDLMLTDRRQRLSSVFIASISSEPGEKSFDLMNKVQSYFEDHTLSKISKDAEGKAIQRGHLWLSVDEGGHNSFMHNSTIEKKQWILDQNFIDSKELMEFRDKAGRTALWLAINYGRTDHVEFLLSRGARIDITNSQGKTLMSMAEERTLNPDFENDPEQGKIFSHLQAIHASRQAMAVVDEVSGRRQTKTP